MGITYDDYVKRDQQKNGCMYKSLGATTRCKMYESESESESESEFKS